MRDPMQDDPVAARPEVTADPSAPGSFEGSEGAEAFAELLPFLTVPRENGTTALREAAEQLAGWLLSAGIPTEVIDYVAEPYALRLSGVVALFGALLYLRCMRSGRFGAALVVAIATPLALLLDLELGWPVFSWLHRDAQVHVAATIAPLGEATQHLIVSAHYDAKTDLFDHAERAWIEGLTVPMTLLMILAAVLARRAGGGRFDGVRRGLVTAVPLAAAGFGALTFATLSGGAFVAQRSPGALDDGAACAAALALAERVAAAPLSRTRLEVLLLSAEEIGTQGARKLARARYAEPPRLPTAVLNLEALGAAPDLAYLEAERFAAWRHEASPRLVALADATHRERTQRPLSPAGAGTTDAREFLARGIPALTLLSRDPDGTLLRGLHSAADDRSRIDLAALGAQLGHLDALVRRVDREGL